MELPSPAPCGVTPKKYAGATCFPQFSIGEVVEFPRRQWDSWCISKALGCILTECQSRDTRESAFDACIIPGIVTFPSAAGAGPPAVHLPSPVAHFAIFLETALRAATPTNRSAGSHELPHVLPRGIPGELPGGVPHGLAHASEHMSMPSFALVHMGWRCAFSEPGML